MKYLLSALLALITLPAFAGNPDAQLSSAFDQEDGQIYTEIVDGISQMTHETSVGLTVKPPGVYMVILAPQTGKGIGCSNYWLQVNGFNVTNSNIQVCQDGENQTTVAVAQSILHLYRGDVITFQMSGDLGIDATQPMGEPLIPSVIISVFKL